MATTIYLMENANYLALMAIIQILMALVTKFVPHVHPNALPA
jgi:hypothetical protein